MPRWHQVCCLGVTRYPEMDLTPAATDSARRDAFATSWHAWLTRNRNKRAALIVSLEPMP